MRGARPVAKRGVALSRLAPFARPALVNGAAGFVVARHRRLLGVAGFTVAHGKIVEIDLLMDPVRLRELDLTDSMTDVRTARPRPRRSEGRGTRISRRTRPALARSKRLGDVRAG